MNEKTLTSEQRATLIAYILMTTKMREEEAAAWDKLAEEKTANHGKPAGVGGFPASDSGDQCAVGQCVSSHLLRSVRGGKLRQLPE